MIYKRNTYRITSIPKSKNFCENISRCNALPDPTPVVPLLPPRRPLVCRIRLNRICFCRGQDYRIISSSMQLVLHRVRYNRMRLDCAIVVCPLCLTTRNGSSRDTGRNIILLLLYNQSTILSLFPAQMTEYISL